MCSLQAVSDIRRQFMERPGDGGPARSAGPAFDLGVGVTGQVSYHTWVGLTSR